jgi:hypothetical protein
LSVGDDSGDQYWESNGIKILLGIEVIAFFNGIVSFSVRITATANTAVFLSMAVALQLTAIQPTALFGMRSDHRRRAGCPLPQSL